MTEELLKLEKLGEVSPGLLCTIIVLSYESTVISEQIVFKIAAKSLNSNFGFVTY